MVVQKRSPNKIDSIKKTFQGETVK